MDQDKELGLGELVHFMKPGARRCLPAFYLGQDKFKVMADHAVSTHGHLGRPINHAPPSVTESTWHYENEHDEYLRRLELRERDDDWLKVVADWPVGTQVKVYPNDYVYEVIGYRLNEHTGQPLLELFSRNAGDYPPVKRVYRSPQLIISPSKLHREGK